MQEYRSMKDKTIHHPYASWASDEQRSMFGLPDWSLMGGFSSSSYVTLTRERQPEDGISHHGNQLLVCIHNKVSQFTYPGGCSLDMKDKLGERFALEALYKQKPEVDLCLWCE